jgi:hypothetical protein
MVTKKPTQMSIIYLVMEYGGIVKMAFINEVEALEFKKKLELEEGGFYTIKEVPYI